MERQSEHIDEPAVVEQEPGSTLLPICRNCGDYLGPPWIGWCWTAQCFVKGGQDCPQWNLRDSEKLFVS